MSFIWYAFQNSNNFNAGVIYHFTTSHAFDYIARSFLFIYYRHFLEAIECFSRVLHSRAISLVLCPPPQPSVEASDSLKAISALAYFVFIRTCYKTLLCELRWNYTCFLLTNNIDYFLLTMPPCLSVEC